MSSVILKKNLVYIGSMKTPKNGLHKNVAIEKAVLFFGGVVKLSEKLNVQQGTVSKWLHSKLLIPVKHAIKIEKLTKGQIKARDLRPDVYED